MNDAPLTFTALVAAIRERMPKGVSWSLRPVFWHHEYEHRPDCDESLEWEFWRSDENQHYKGTTPEHLLAVAFPPPVALADGMALVDA